MGDNMSRNLNEETRVEVNVEPVTQGEPVLKWTFDECFEQMKRYMHKVAGTYAGNHPFNDEEDIFQNLSLALWNCWKDDSYTNFTQFRYLYTKAVANVIADFFRLKCVENDKATIRIDATAKGERTSGAETYKQTRTEMSEDFYRAGIFELIQSIDPETAKVVMESLDKANRGPKPGRARAYDKVKNKLNEV